MDIINDSIESVKPDEAVRRALKAFAPKGGRVLLVAAGKAAWQMAHAAVEALGRVDGGVVVTKYDHVKGEIPGVKCYEAGHPVPDENSFAATERALELVHGLTEKDTVLFLLSGGGSALFEKPLIPGAELQGITNQLLASGADIVEMNTIRKRLSAVKGGRFAQACAPAKVFSIVLSDILGDPLDMIASGRRCRTALPVHSTCHCGEIPSKPVRTGEGAAGTGDAKSPRQRDHPDHRQCARTLRRCGCSLPGTWIRTDPSDRPALLRSAGSRQLPRLHRPHPRRTGQKLAYIAGGETVVHLTGNGLGGRNQELALAAAPALAGLEHCCVFSVGSDGTDGPTDAAGGYVDGQTDAALRTAGWDVFAALQNNDAYHAMQAIGGLIITGPTGTNVNDVSVALVDG